jgi:hypothetical protein
MRTIGIAALMLLAVSCRETTAPVADATFRQAPPAEITVHIGETVIFSGIEITFNAVIEDSRCPVDVVCPWSGNAAVELAVGPGLGDGPTYHLVLNSDQEPRAGEAWNLSITLLSVHPAPVSTEPIPPDAYEVVLKVERIDMERIDARATRDQQE